jgi:hypothetical protein
MAATSQHRLLRVRTAVGKPWGWQKIKDIAKYVLWRSGMMRKRRAKIAHALRAHAIGQLTKAPHVDARFLIRSQFSFNAVGVLVPGATRENAQRQRDEFVANMLDTEYHLCTRGYGNCSIRLYEALSCGRIPVLIDTSCVMPWQERIAWRYHLVWIDESEIDQIDTRLSSVHAGFSPEAFADRQARCRSLFHHWLRPEAFFARLPEHWI